MPVDYVSVAKVFTGARLYFSGEGVRQQVTPEIIKRRSIIKLIQAGQDKDDLAILRSEKVQYIYYYGKVSPTYNHDQRFKILFQNNASTIVKILP